MPLHKLVHLIGTSEKSWQDAAEMAVEDAAITIRNIQKVNIMDLSADIENGKIKRYNTSIELTFEIDESLRHVS